MKAANFISLVVVVATLAGGHAGAVEAENAAAQRQLEALKARISSIEQAHRRAARARDRESQALREVETAVAREARALEETRRERLAVVARRDELVARRAELAVGLEADTAALAAELRAAWMAGGEPRLKLMLSQRDPTELGRMLAWYGYVARERAGRVEHLRERLAEVAAVGRQLEAERERLQAAEARQAEAVAELDQARAARARAVAELDADLVRRDQEAERLRQEAAALEELIEALRVAVADMPIAEATPFAAQRGRLAWPVRGVLARDFGARRGGGPRSNGVLIAAERGTDVRAVWHGRVAYADWLPGLGLLLVLEHGDDYMSLYAHNEVLFSAVGDWISAGQVIGRVGDSGGRDKSGLYFEIRSGTQPQNPTPWFYGQLTGN
ncbi:MAG TPA: peptidoglycan DD-metalloendopeptidase family protein [Gammaproteobacteria bacterium]|nr:peptidoglycan DD-metalloendopeptidase family protein [Gammaproteobacteria bacterium]